MSNQCPKCGSIERAKDGIVHNMQRWRCKGCDCRYTKSSRRGYPESVRRQAVQMHLEGMGFRQIGRILKVSNVAVLKWVRQAAHHNNFANGS